ncbi:MAG: hypothetical protein NTY51_06890 [Deltaproteobacteria bacterium]|nr:hypothetical protein [Deltaproteobacteria bacterium]
MERREEIRLTIAKIIREKSEAGQLVQFEELLTELAGQGLSNSDVAAHQRSHFEGVLRQVVSENGDIKEISSRNRIPHYYSSRSLSETYAGILVRKEEKSLIAEIVRENSAIYPRPVPLNIFREPPFDLTQKEILDCLEKMGKQGEYQDIAQTTTSIGTVFLYSNQHLDQNYASTLAEWLDVGQVNNP